MKLYTSKCTTFAFSSFNVNFRQPYKAETAVSGNHVKVQKILG